MKRLSEPMQQIIRHYSAGSVASINEDGTPAVSPKATFVIVDDTSIAYGDIRSPGTSANLIARPAVEVSFIDILARVAVRIKGNAQVITKGSDLGQRILPQFEELWSAYLELMSGFVFISIHSAELITSPAYDVAIKREELIKANFEKLSKLI